MEHFTILKWQAWKSWSDELDIGAYILGGQFPGLVCWCDVMPKNWGRERWTVVGHHGGCWPDSRRKASGATVFYLHHCIFHITVSKYKFWRERGLGAVLIGLPFPAHRCLLSWTANYSLPWLELNCPNRWLRQASLKLKNKCQRQLLCLKQSLCFLLILQGITVITKMNLYSP